MNHHDRSHDPSRRHGLLLLAAIAVLTFAPGIAGAAPLPCETGNPCTVGICTEEGDCEESPANNGQPCETYDPCTMGTCTDGDCAESPANNGQPCETNDPCMQEAGQCSQGDCLGTPLSNGSPCREDVFGPCIIGTCTTIGKVSFCTPTFKCGLSTNPCVYNCNPANGNCEPFELHVCDDFCRTGTCVPGQGSQFTCTNIQNRADNTPCYDGEPCNGDQDKCQLGVCVGSGQTSVCGDGSVEGPEQCDDGDDVFAWGDYCDDLCMLVPCGKPTNSSGALPKASDALFALRAGVGQVDCDPLVCDVDDNGAVTASDALRILRKAVGLAETLDCPLA